MRSLSTTQRRLYTALFLVAGLFGFATQRAFAVASQPAPEYDKQCYYDAGGTPSCQYCEQTCLGQGYVCCKIVVQPQT